MQTKNRGLNMKNIDSKMTVEEMFCNLNTEAKARFLFDIVDLDFLVELRTKYKATPHDSDINLIMRWLHEKSNNYKLGE